MLPPYNEHLIRDVGNYKLAFAVLFAWAAWRPSRELVVPLAAGWSVAALLHAGYHALHLDGFGAGDAIALIAVLVAALALPVLAIVITRRQAAATTVSERELAFRQRLDESARRLAYGHLEGFAPVPRRERHGRDGSWSGTALPRSGSWSRSRSRFPPRSPRRRRRRRSRSFVNGQAQVVPAFNVSASGSGTGSGSRRSSTSDGDGKRDRMHVDVTRPAQTDSEA